MTVDTTDNTVTGTGDGVTDTLSFPYLVYQASHLTITLDGVATSAWSAATYGDAAGVTITFDTAPTNGAAIVAQRIVPYTQDTDLENFDGNDADVTEKQFDLLAMATQQLAEEVARSIVGPIGTALTTNVITGTIDSTVRILTITDAGPATASISDLSSDLDTVISAVAAGDILHHNGTNWVNATTLTGNYTMSGNIIFSGKTSFSDDGELTILSGAVTITGSNHTIDTEGDAASDDLDTINGGSDGEEVTLRIENDAREVVVKDGTGNIKTPDGNDVTLTDDENAITFVYDAALSKWLVKSVFGSTSAATTTSAGVVEKATAAEVLAETGEKYPDSALLTNHAGIAKAWVNFDGTAVDGVADLTGVGDSYNIASVVDNGTGDYTVTLSNAMANANFVVTAGGRRATGASELDGEIQAWPTSTTTFDVRTSSSSTGAQDWDIVCITIHGDLA